MTNACDYNFSFFEETSRSTSGKIVTIQDIIGGENRQYMLMILLSSTIMLLYVLYVNFVMGTRFDILTKYKIDIHELAILPGVALFIISLSFFKSV